MKYLPYILKHLRRNWIRTSSTVLALTLCVFLFCTLQTALKAIDFSQTANATRLVVRHKVSLFFNIPLAYEGRIAAVPGVKKIAVQNWFGGIYKDPKDFFANFAIEAVPFLEIYPEMLLEPDQKAAFLKDPRGAIVGRDLANKFNWKVGDVFQLESTIPPYRVGGPLEFVVSGIYTSDDVKNPGTDLSTMFFHYKYLYEKTGQRAQPGLYVVQIDDPEKGAAIGRAIDQLFENTDAQTKTETEAAFAASFMSLAGNLALLVNSIAIAVIFTILLVTANTMSMAVRERRTEIAVLKTLGFSSGRVMGLVLAEGAMLGLIGGVIGVVASNILVKALPGIPMFGAAFGSLSRTGLPPLIAVLSIALALAIGLTAGIAPATGAFRARITDMLRQV